MIGDDSFQEVERLKTTNALYLSSLENLEWTETQNWACIPPRRQCICDRTIRMLLSTPFIAWYQDYSETWGEASSVSSRKGSLISTGTLSDEISTICFRDSPDHEFADTSMRHPSPRGPSNLSQNPKRSKDLNNFSSPRPSLRRHRPGYVL